MKKSDVVHTMHILPRDHVKYLMGTAARLNTEMCNVCPGIGFQGYWAYSLDEHYCATAIRLPWHVCEKTEIPDVNLKLYEPPGIEDGLVEGTISINWDLLVDQLIKRFKGRSFRRIRLTVSPKEFVIKAYGYNEADSRVIINLEDDFTSFEHGSVVCDFEDFHRSIKGWPEGDYSTDPGSEEPKIIHFLLKPDLCRLYWLNTEHTVWGSIPEIRGEQ